MIPSPSSAYRGFVQDLVIGSGVTSGLVDELSQLSVRRVALLTSPSVQVGSTFRAIRDALTQFEIVATSSNIRPHAPIGETEALSAFLRDVHPDVIVAVGGGSVSDTAKGSAILLAEGGSLEDHCSTFEQRTQLVQPTLMAAKIPIVTIPTTLSGAEMTPGGAATNNSGIKRTFWDPKIASRLVFYDSVTLAETPRSILVATAMNGLAHCAEGLYSKTQNPVSSALAVRGAYLFTSGLLRNHRDPSDKDALLTLAEAAALGGMVISHARVGLHHAICHVLGTTCGLAHGVANSVMLPYVLQFNEPATRAAQNQLASAMANGFVAAQFPPPPSTILGTSQNAAVIVSRLRSILGAPSSLSEAGVPKRALQDVANRTMHDRGVYFNPRSVEGPDEVFDILLRAWSGEPLRV